MPELIRHVILNLVGLALVTFGAYATASHYPSPGQLAMWSKAMPVLHAMMAFSLSIAAVIVGLTLLVHLLWRRRRYSRRNPAFSASSPYDRVPAPRSAAERYDDDYQFEPEGHHGRGYDDPRGGADRGYVEGDGERYRGNGEYRDYDERRRASAFR